MAQNGHLDSRKHPHPSPLPEGEGAGAGHLGLIAAAVLIIGLVVGPLWWHQLDVQGFWLRWAAASGGTSPAAMYRDAKDCNYPPIVPYLLTGTQWLRLHVPLAMKTRVAVELVKLPNLLAILAGGWVVAVGMRPLVRRSATRSMTIEYLLCPALFVDAAVWGQYEALMVLGMLAAVVLLLRDRPGWAGACAGAALAVKLQAFVILPALAVYAGRRLGIGAVVKAGVATAGAVLLLAAPAILGGGGRGVLNSYVGAVDHYRELTIHAGNVWQPLLFYRKHLLHQGMEKSRDDSHPILGPLAPKQIGLAAFGLYTLLLLTVLWKRPDRYAVVMAAVLTSLGFFMLPTQIHDRYVLPAIALLILLVPFGQRAAYWTLTVAIVPVLLMSIYAGNLREHHAIRYSVTRFEDGVYLAAVVPNLIVFAWLTVVFCRRALAGVAGPPDSLSEGAA